MTTDINGTLFHHLSTGSGAAYVLRRRRPELLKCVERLFQARSDIHRLHAAQDVAALVLEQHDFDDLLPLRSIVAVQELRRQITYAKQKDHTAHTVYLYLLGIWLFHHLPQLREAFRRKHKIANEVVNIGDGQYVLVDRVDHEFLFQWTYASLLHDVGYAFYDLSKDTIDDRREIDNLYAWKFVRRFCRAMPSKAQSAIESAHNAWKEENHSSTSLTTFREGQC